MTREVYEPGEQVRTPHGLAWVNVRPNGAPVPKGKVFVRLNDDSTVLLNASEVTLAVF